MVVLLVIIVTHLDVHDALGLVHCHGIVVYDTLATVSHEMSCDLRLIARTGHR